MLCNAEEAVRQSKLELLLAACKALLEAPHQDHFASRLGDEEMEALESIKKLVKELC